jgi:hypothetical protein
MWPFWRFLESRNVLGKMGRSPKKNKERKKKTNSKHKKFGTR